MLELFHALKNKFTKEEINGRDELKRLKKKLIKMKKENVNIEVIKELEDNIYWKERYGEEDGVW
jgi:hypothetical protein